MLRFTADYLSAVFLDFKSRRLYRADMQRFESKIRVATLKRNRAAETALLIIGMIILALISPGLFPAAS